MSTTITVSTSGQGPVCSEQGSACSEQDSALSEQGPVRRGETGDAPAQFLWDGRLHLVRAVLGHVTRGRVEEWRVRASAGRDSAPRVFVLRFDWSEGRWSVSPEPLGTEGSPEPLDTAGSPEPLHTAGSPVAAVRVEVPA
jgi:hypothetical protein